MFFERGIPHIYEGDLMKEDDLLGWLIHQKRHSEIPEVTDEMKDKLIESTKHLAVIFCKFISIDWLIGIVLISGIISIDDKDDKQDIRVLNELENIDDELEKEGIVIVRIDNADEAKEYGLDHLPTLIYFEEGIPSMYEGDLMNEEEVLEWLILQKDTATIEEVTDEILEDLIEDHEYVVAYCKFEERAISLHMYQWKIQLWIVWIFLFHIQSRAHATRVTDAIIFWVRSAENFPLCFDHVVFCLPFPVFFLHADDLENIDDELDEAGIIFVTTEDTAMAKSKLNIKTFPQLVFFRNRDPLFYKGDIDDEDEVLAWLTDENTLEIPGKIEEVNSKMLEKILSENDYVVVFFCESEFWSNQITRRFVIAYFSIVLFVCVCNVDSEGDKKAQKILNELENIDDECEEKSIDFVKTSDDGIDKEYDLVELPALAFYRNKFRTIYKGDLMKEEEILDWVLDLFGSDPDVIETVDRKTLQVLINDVEHLAVFFCKFNITSFCRHGIIDQYIRSNVGINNFHHWISDDDKCESCPGILEELETIDDDTDDHNIQFVKSNDVKLAHEIGIFSFPALVYYETGVPIMYDGRLLFRWIVQFFCSIDFEFQIKCFVFISIQVI